MNARWQQALSLTLLCAAAAWLVWQWPHSPAVALAGLAALAAELGVEIGVWFTTAAHPVAVDLPDCPVGLSVARRCLNLPTLLPAGHPHAAGS